MKVAIVFGTRPQFIKLAPLVGKLEDNKQMGKIYIHTGQHYDEELSYIFFKSLKLPKPHYNLNIGSNAHGEQTGQMLTKIEKVFLKENPNYLIVIGDTNSTLSGALAAAKIGIPIIHMEAGIRSEDMTSPEEINRRIVDCISDFLIPPTESAALNLISEGIEASRILMVGDITDEAVGLVSSKIDQSPILTKFNLVEEFLIATIHRAENTDNITRLKAIMTALDTISLYKKVVMPIHPRTSKILSKNKLKYKNIQFIKPLDYIEFLSLLNKSSLVITDSGGIQKEALILGVPCITVRDNTEWRETIELGVNNLVKADSKMIENLVKSILNKRLKKVKNPFGSNNLTDGLIKMLTDGITVDKVSHIDMGFPKYKIMKPNEIDIYGLGKNVKIIAAFDSGGNLEIPNLENLSQHDKLFVKLYQK